MKFDKKSDVKTIGDKKTLGTRNIPLFWNSKRYYAENVYHAIATTCILLFTFLFVLLIILVVAGVFPNGNKTAQNPPLLEQVLLIITFFSIVAFIILKFAERKIRKQRMLDFADSFSREIEVK